jgi:hypothetical protein
VETSVLKGLDGLFAEFQRDRVEKMTLSYSFFGTPSIRSHDEIRIFNDKTQVYHIDIQADMCRYNTHGRFNVIFLVVHRVCLQYPLKVSVIGQHFGGQGARHQSCGHFSKMLYVRVVYIPDYDYCMVSF